jgi:hypothetical protein
MIGTLTYKGDHTKQYEMGRVCGTCGGEEKYIHGLGRRNRRKGTTWMT